MSIAARLEKGLEFFKANAWGQTVDRQKSEGAPDGYAYCARGAVIFGAFAEAVDGYCPHDSRFHDGPCQGDGYGECDNNKRHAVGREFENVMLLFDDVARAVEENIHFGVAWYNDALGRTKDDMIALFEKAIAKAKEAGE